MVMLDAAPFSMLDAYWAYLRSLEGYCTYRAVNPNSAFPERYHYTDCAGSQCAAMRHVGIMVPSTSGYLYSGALYDWCEMLGKLVPVDEARHRRGILLFRGFRGRDHIACSGGNNDQWAAHGRYARPQLGLVPFGGPWYAASEIPFMSYDTAEPHQEVPDVARVLAPDRPLTAKEQPAFVGKKPMVVAWEHSAMVFLVEREKAHLYTPEIVPAAIFAFFDIREAPEGTP